MRTVEYLVVSLCFLVSARSAQPKATDCASPLWSAEILQDLSASRTIASPQLLDNDRAGLTFVGNNRLLAYEVDRDLGQLSSRQSPDISSPFRLRAYVIDSATGKVLFTKEWGTRAHDSSIQAVSGGVLLRTGELLRLYRQDFSEIRRVVLPVHTDRCLTSISSTRETIMVNCFDQQKNVSYFNVFDGSALKLEYSWAKSPPLYHSYSISDTAVVAATQTSDRIFTSSFASGRWKPIGPQFKDSCVGVPTVLKDNVTFARTCAGFIAISENANVNLLYKPEKNERDWRDKVSVSQAGNLLAVSLDRIQGTDFWDTGKGIRLAAEVIHVLDVFANKPAFSIEIAPPPKNDYDFALSPDGFKIAILTDRRVSVCSISPK